MDKEHKAKRRPDMMYPHTTFPKFSKEDVAKLKKLIIKGAGKMGMPVDKLFKELKK